MTTLIFVKFCLLLSVMNIKLVWSWTFWMYSCKILLWLKYVAILETEVTISVLIDEKYLNAGMDVLEKSDESLDCEFFHKPLNHYNKISLLLTLSQLLPKAGFFVTSGWNCHGNSLFFMSLIYMLNHLYLKFGLWIKGIFKLWWISEVTQWYHWYNIFPLLIPFCSMWFSVA